MNDNNEAMQILIAIAELLYPSSDPLQEWSVETIEYVAELVESHPTIGASIRERCEAAEAIDAPPAPSYRWLVSRG